nr:hypothetical protein [Tanacetum cinerariifolium]
MNGGDWFYHGSSGCHEDYIVYGLTKMPRISKAILKQSSRDSGRDDGELYDFVRSDKAFARTKLPKGEAGEHAGKFSLLAVRREDRSYRNNQWVEGMRNDNRNNHRRDRYDPYRGRDNQAPYPLREGIIRLEPLWFSPSMLSLSLQNKFWPWKHRFARVHCTERH